MDLPKMSSTRVCPGLEITPISQKKRNAVAFIFTFLGFPLRSRIREFGKTVFSFSFGHFEGILQAIFRLLATSVFADYRRYGSELSPSTHFLFRKSFQHLHEPGSLHPAFKKILG